MTTKYHIHDLFSDSLKGVGAVLLAVVITGVIYKIQFHAPSSFSTRGTPAPSPTVLPRKNLSFTQPFACQAVVREASMSAYRQGPQAYVQTKRGKVLSRILLTGDCVYSWQEGTRQGVKTCGAGQYLSTADALLSTGLLNMDSVLGMIPKDIDLSSWGFTMDEAKELLSTCENRTVKDAGVFVLPKNVTFKEAKVIGPSVAP